MSVTREEDRQKSSCPSRGLGVAAAAIGVGVGAALYYFFNKRAEHPNTEGSTSDWNCQRPHPFYITQSSDDSFTTISEHDTTDTSMNDETQLVDDLFEHPTGLDMSVSDSDDSDDTESEDDVLSSNSDMLVDSDSDYDEFEITTSSLGIPEDDDRSRSPVMSLLNNSLSWVSRVGSRRHRNHLTEEEQMSMIRQEQFRERSWTLEDCSICFDVMLRNQDLTRLPCAHNFHTECILPWLQEKHTCPMCRKNAE